MASSKDHQGRQKMILHPNEGTSSKKYFHKVYQFSLTRQNLEDFQTKKEKSS